MVRAQRQELYHVFVVNDNIILALNVCNSKICDTVLFFQPSISYIFLNARLPILYKLLLTPVYHTHLTFRIHIITTTMASPRQA